MFLCISHKHKFKFRNRKMKTILLICTLYDIGKTNSVYDFIVSICFLFEETMLLIFLVSSCGFLSLSYFPTVSLSASVCIIFAFTAMVIILNREVPFSVVCLSGNVLVCTKTIVFNRTFDKMDQYETKT